MAFTNPCDECKYDSETCRYWPKCNSYRYWMNYCWKCARNKARRTETRAVSKWVYQHPDDARKYLEEGVCNGCPLNGNCDHPCRAYLEWYNARMDYFRKVAGV